MNRVAEWIATGAQTGRFPVAPATFASAVAISLYGVLPIGNHSVAFWVIVVVAFFVGVWASSVISTAADPDPHRAVIDEWVAVWITAAFLPKTVWWLLVAFLVFRVLDVLKPWPIRKLERLPSGWGIMADDLAAGIVGAAVLNAIRIAFFR